MIAASRRRRPGVGSVEEAFHLHRIMARRTGLGRRLLRGSLAALVCSLLALLIGVDLVTHGVIVAVSFVIGFAVPVPGLRQQALAEIRSHVGMSYETALGILEEPAAPIDSPTGVGPGPDPFGFKAAVIDRARHAVADVRPTPAPAWWLPALAVALALLLVSGLDLGGPSGATGPNGAISPPPGSSVVPLDARDDVSDDDELVAPQDEAPGRAQEPDADAQSPNDDDEGADRTTPEPAEGAGDGAPMSRFLDSLRERPPESGGNDQPGRDREGQGAPGAQPPGQGQAGGDREGDPERVELPSDPGSQSGDGAQAGEAGDDGDGQDGGDSVMVASETGEEGDADSPGEAQEGPSDGQAPGDRQSADNQPAEGGAEGEQGLEQGGAADGEGSDDPASEGAAGVGGGQENDAGVADGQAERPEFLRGVLEQGPESPAGAVRLPGQTDVTLPLSGSAPADYAAAAEEALSEGDLPLSYQEIIRRYFR